MNKKIDNGLAVGIILLIVITLGFGFWLGNKKIENDFEQSNYFEKKEANNSEENILSKNDSEEISINKKNNIIKECASDKKICPDGVLVARMLDSNCNFPECNKGKYDMSDSTYKTYINNQYGIKFKYPNKLVVSTFVDHESEYDGDLIVKMNYYSSVSDQMNIKLYFSKNLSKYPDLSKTIAKIRKSTGASVNELHNFGFPGFEGYEILWWNVDGKHVKEENYQFLKLDNGFYYFKTTSTQPLKDLDSYVFRIISTFESTNK